MTTPRLEQLRTEADAFMEAISREQYRAASGLTSTASLEPIYRQYAAILDEDALAMVLEQFRGAATGSEEHRSARTLLEWEAEAQASRQLASVDEREIAWEASAMVPLPDGGRIPYQRIGIEIATAADRERRLMLDGARAALVERELAPLKRERLQREQDIIDGLGIAGGYNATFEALSGIALGGLVSQCQQFLRDTQAMWDDVFPEFVRRTLGIEPGEATRADALALFRAREFDAYFPGGAMQRVVAGQAREMGIDANAAGRIIYDVGERDGKRSRAFCAPVRVPHEVYLVLLPHGGHADYHTLLHELGHALHFAHMRPDLPFEYRWLGDNSITEGYAMLFDHLMQNPGWLLRYTELDRPHLGAFLRAAGFQELHFLRRYCAKLIYEHELHGGDDAWGRLPDLYVDTLTGATNFQYRRADAFIDVDARFYAARYLRAWQLQSLIAETLVERYDEDWFRNPRAGPWITQALFGEGQRELADEQARRVSGRTLGFAPLIRAAETLLSSA